MGRAMLYEKLISKLSEGAHNDLNLLQDLLNSSITCIDRPRVQCHLNSLVICLIFRFDSGEVLFLERVSCISTLWKPYYCLLDDLLRRGNELG